MKYIIILYYLFVISHSLKSQTVITSTNVSETIEYSYDKEGNLIKNFSQYNKVIPDSVESIIQGTWLIKEYESWEKEKVDTFKTILKFDNDSISLIQGDFLNRTIFLNGIFTIKPNNAEGAEITITNIDSSPNYLHKIEMFVIHCERNILFVSIMSFDSKTSNVYNGMYKMIKQE